VTISNGIGSKSLQTWSGMYRPIVRQKPIDVSGRSYRLILLTQILGSQNWRNPKFNKSTGTVPVLRRSTLLHQMTQRIPSFTIDHCCVGTDHLHYCQQMALECSGLWRSLRRSEKALRAFHNYCFLITSENLQIVTSIFIACIQLIYNPNLTSE
jgi:hypothetical protein